MLFNTVSIEQNSTLWMGNTYGYYHVDPNTSQVEQFHIPDATPTKPDAEGIFSSYLQGDTILWLGGWGTGLIRHDLRRGTATRYFYTDPSKEMNAVYSIIRADIHGQSHWLWVGSLKGLMAFDTDTRRFTPYHTQDIFNYKGVTGAVFSFFEDADQALWIGSGDGLFRYDPRKQGVDKIDLNPFELCFPVDNIAFENIQPGTEQIWFTIPYCGWHKYNLKTKEIEALPESLQRELKDAGIFDIYIDRKDRLWIGTNEKGLLVFDLKRNQFTPFSRKYFNENGKWVSEIFESAAGQIWVGTFDGLFRFDDVLQQFVDIEPIRSLIRSKSIAPSIYSLAQDQKGNIWATTYFDDDRSSSLICYNVADDIATHYDRYVTPDFNSIHEFRDVVCTRDGTLFLTTDRGLFAIANGEINHLKDFPEFETNLGTSVYSLAVDGNDEVWVSTAYGVARFNADNNTIFTYDYTTSLLGPGRIPGIWYDRISNKVFVAQKGSIDVISPSLPATHSVRLHCLGIFINQVEVDTLRQRLRSLKYDQNDLEINLALPAYSNAKNNLFRYILEGYQNEWTTSGSGKIIYNNLPPGTYSFRAVGITSEGQLSNNSITIPFHIHPPFWKTLWFQLALLAIVSGLILSFFLFRDRQRRQLQQVKYAIARDLHDDMGSNLSTIKLLSEFELMKNPESDQKTLRTILDKTNLVMENMYEIIWNINPSKNQGIDMAEKIKSYIIQTLEPLDMAIHFDIGNESHLKAWRLTTEHRRHIFLIFKEAVNNIAKYSTANKVDFAIHAERKQLVLSIRDNGIGFEPSAIQPGNGLLNMNTRALALKGELVIDTKPGEGTCVKLILPHT